MKIKLTSVSRTMALAAMLNIAGTALLLADNTAPPQTAEKATQEAAFKGTVTAVDPNEKTVAVQGFWGTRTFNISDDCLVTLEDQPTATLADLQPGQEVMVQYKNADGVLVAHQIAQHNIRFVGYVANIDTAKGTLTVQHGMFTRNFTIRANCNVVLHNDRSGVVDDIKAGNTVTVVYENVNGALMASRIEEKNASFSGTIEAIDATTRTVKAKNLLVKKKFNLADGCKIVIAGKPIGELKDLRIGDHATFSYDDSQGVLIADCLALDQAAKGSESQTEAVNQ